MLDASALLALLLDEQGAAVTADAIATGAAVLGAVNLSEVAATLTAAGLDLTDVLANVRAALTVEAFTEADAMAAAALVLPIRTAGLSLGDRACLALAQRLGAPALTADRAWSSVALPASIEVRQIRASPDVEGGAP